MVAKRIYTIHLRLLYNPTLHVIEPYRIASGSNRVRSKVKGGIHGYETSLYHYNTTSIDSRRARIEPDRIASGSHRARSKVKVGLYGCEANLYQYSTTSIESNIACYRTL
jgi:hypothetical protein